MSWNKTSEPLVYTYDAYDADGNKRTAKWVVGVESSGNITPFDGKVFSAFHAYAGEVREREGSLPKVLPVSVNRLGQLLGYTSMRGYDSSPGSAYGNIKSSLRRIGAVRCSSTQAYWSIEEESWLTIDFNIFTSVVFRGQRIGRKGRTIEKCWVDLHPVYHGNLARQHVKYFDYQYLLSLPPLEARLYQLLSLKFYGALQQGRRWYRVDYRKWCAELPVQPQQRPPRARQAFARAHERLLADGVIGRKVQVGKTQRKQGQLTFNLTFWVGERVEREMRGQFGDAPQPAVDQEVIPFSRPIVSLASSTEPVDDDETELASTGLVKQLEERGVASTQARTFVSEHPEDRIRRQLDHFAYMQSHQPGVIKNPGAWLNAAITRDHDLPEGLRDAQDARERDAKREDRLRRWSEERGRRIDADLRDWDTIPPEDRISGRLKMAASKWSQDFRELARELGKDAAVERTRQGLLAGLPKTKQERRAFLESQHDVTPPDDFE